MGGKYGTVNTPFSIMLTHKVYHTLTSNGWAKNGMRTIRINMPLISRLRNLMARHLNYLLNTKRLLGITSVYKVAQRGNMKKTFISNTPVTSVAAETSLRQKTAAYIRKHKAKILVVLATLLIIGHLCYWFLVEGLWLWAGFLALVFIGFWITVDTRIRGFMPSVVKPILESLARKIDENPPTILMAACYPLGFAGAAVIAILLLTHKYDLEAAYQMANVIATYVFFLLVAGVAAQLGWIIYKKAGKSRSR